MHYTERNIKSIISIMLDRRVFKNTFSSKYHFYVRIKNLHKGLFTNFLLFFIHAYTQVFNCLKQKTLTVGCR